MLNISESESESESGSESDSSGNSRTILTYHSEIIFLTTICTSVNRSDPFGDVFSFASVPPPSRSCFDCERIVNRIYLNI